MGYVDYRLALSPAWLLGPNGQAWSGGFGQQEDAFLTLARYAVQARFPGLAPLDAPGSGVSQALALIGNDRQLLPSFGDDANLDKYRAWLQTGFTSQTVATVSSWLPSTPYAVNATVGTGGSGQINTSGTLAIYNGLVWICAVGGVSGTSFPFPAMATQGQQVVDGTVTWSWQGSTIYPTQGPNPMANGPLSVATPPNPAAPGYAFAGTDNGLLAALINSGFYAVGPGGSIIPPRIYNNRDFVSGENLQYAYENFTLAFAGALPGAMPGFATPGADHYVITLRGPGTVGQSGAIIFEALTGEAPTSWSPALDVAAGMIVADPNYLENSYLALNAGTTGTDNPFRESPPPSQWPPPPGQGYYDNGVFWISSTFSPIPPAIPLGGAPGSWGAVCTGDLTSSGYVSFDAQWTPDPPDGNAAAWARLWLVLPVANVLSPPLPWDYDTTGAGIWQANTQYNAGAIVAGDSNFWVALYDGQSGSDEPGWPASPTNPTLVTDGTITWAWNGGSVFTGYVANPMLGTVIRDSYNHVWYCTTGGTSGSPSWPSDPAVGQTVQDGGATWTYFGSPIDTWLPNQAYSLGALVRDLYGHGWVCTVAGTSGGGEPTWTQHPAAGVTPQADGSVTWTCAWDGSAVWRWDGDATVNGVATLTPPYWDATPKAIEGTTNIFGLVNSLLRNWSPAHVLPIGFWFTFGNVTLLDTPYPPAPWDESQATIGDLPVPFAIINPG